MKRKHLALWACICLLIVLIGIAVPVEESRSQGIGGANQANLRGKTAEITKECELEFIVKLPSEKPEQIGFFFTFNGHAYGEEKLRLSATAGDTTIGSAEYNLKECLEDRFLFVPLLVEDLEQMPEKIRVSIFSDAKIHGPSIWLNEVSSTPGTLYVSGQEIPKSPIYNLSYKARTHRFRGPFFTGLILLLFGTGVYGAGGFVREQKRNGRNHQPVFVLPSGRELAVLAGLILVVAMAFYYLYDTQIRIAQNTTEKKTVLSANGELLPINEENSELTQAVKPKEDRLTGLGVRLFLEDGAVLSQGNIQASVTDLTIGQTLCRGGRSYV